MTTTTTRTERVALYARISHDDRGDARGVGRQLTDAEALAERNGWTVVDRYTDNDISAYSGKARPEYQRLMRDVAAGGIDRIVVYQSSRLWRSRTERAGDIDRLAAHRVNVTAVSGPDLDLSSASGRMLAGILGEFDTAESAIKSERVSRAIRERAEQGKANRVAYGWERTYTHGDQWKGTGWTDGVHPVQGAVVRECAARVIGGDGLHGIAADLNARGVPPPRRGEWTGGTVRALLLRESNAGRVVHQGEVIGVATYPALLTEDVHRSVRSILTDPSRKVSRGNTRKHLLSLGIAVCDACGGEVSVANRTRKPDGVE
ncbi:MAG: recombinase family protein, partial [Euzebya sp.]